MRLIDAALAVRDKAHAPYSRFKVGAAIRTTDGQVFLGVNVENASYPEGTCAETGAIAAIVAAGQTRIAEIAVVGDAPEPVVPCGGCRQRIAEFAGRDTLVIMANTDGAVRRMTADELLPAAFRSSQLGGV